MSPWAHLICEPDYVSHYPLRPQPPRVGTGGTPEPCCFCGEPTTSGIYVRHDPNLLPCRAQSAAHHQGNE